MSGPTDSGDEGTPGPPPVDRRGAIPYGAFPHGMITREDRWKRVPTSHSPLGGGGFRRSKGPERGTKRRGTSGPRRLRAPREPPSRQPSRSLGWSDHAGAGANESGEKSRGPDLLSSGALRRDSPGRARPRSSLYSLRYFCKPFAPFCKPFALLPSLYRQASCRAHAS